MLLEANVVVLRQHYYNYELLVFSMTKLTAKNHRVLAVEGSNEKKQLKEILCCCHYNHHHHHHHHRNSNDNRHRRASHQNSMHTQHKHKPLGDEDSNYDNDHSDKNRDKKEEDVPPSAEIAKLLRSI